VSKDAAVAAAVTLRRMRDFKKRRGICHFAHLSEVIKTSMLDGTRFSVAGGCAPASWSW
jgi:hypothetical protein